LGEKTLFDHSAKNHSEHSKNSSSLCPWRLNNF
jgi:hypothetical protein